jgi:YD repeat-containing protein
MPESLPGTVDIVRWVRVAPSWMGHRPEPLVHERMWACPLELGGDQLAYDGRLHEAGFDVAGRPVVLRRSLPGLQPHDEIETVEYREREIVVTLPGATVATTTIDDHGRPLRTVYSGAEAGEETYQYDDAGRLAAIDEADGLWMTVSFCEWDRTGGRLAVEHDGGGPLRVTDSGGGIRWERCDEPWQDLLERGARAIRDGVLRVVGDYCRAHAVPPTTEVFALMLTYVDQGSLYPTLSFGLEADRRRWLSADLGSATTGSRFSPQRTTSSSRSPSTTRATHPSISPFAPSIPRPASRSGMRAGLPESPAERMSRPTNLPLTSAS